MWNSCSRGVDLSKRDILSGAVVRLIRRKVLGRLDRLTEDEVNDWRGGVWEIADDVIYRYHDRLLAHRGLAMKGVKACTPEFISREMVRLKPEFENYWRDEVFFTRLSEEVETLKSFLSGNKRI